MPKKKPQTDEVIRFVGALQECRKYIQETGRIDVHTGELWALALGLRDESTLRKINSSFSSLPYSSTLSEVLTGLDKLADSKMLAPLPSEAKARFKELRTAVREAAKQVDETREMQKVRAPRGPAHNLPESLSSFIGRVDEQAELQQLLKTERLVTFTGSGGCGKTRLALRVAENLIADFPDGVRFVELASVTDPADVPRAVAEVLRVRIPPDRPILTSLIDYLQTRRLLLLLDNCEHLIVPSRELVSALRRSCKSLHILVTSRERLRATGEKSHRVPSLSLPPRNLPAVGRLTDYEAVHLFLERARLSCEGFGLTDRNAATVVEVCRRLDGIPLAIELAAARMGGLGLQKIAAGIDDRFGLLSVGSLDVLPRQQTLRATLNWSYNLLDEREEALINWLSVFAGGWTMEAAEALCAKERLPQWDIPDGLDSLVGKSLVQSDESGEGTRRYRLLETIREYAAMHLEASGRREAAQESHACYFVDYVTAASERIYEKTGADSLAALKRELDAIKVEYDNLQAAWNWLMTSTIRLPEAPVLAIRLATALYRYWDHQGNIGDGRRWLEVTLKQVGDAIPAGLLASACNMAGDFACQQYDLKPAKNYIERALRLLDTLPDGEAREDRLYSVQVLANIASEEDAYDLSESLYDEAYYLSDEWARDDPEEEEPRWAKANIRHNQGLLMLRKGCPDRAHPFFTQSLALWKELKNSYPAGLAMTLGALAILAVKENRAEAERHLTASLGLPVRDKVTIAELVDAWAALVGQAESYQEAAQLFGVADAVREQAGVKQTIEYQKILNDVVVRTKGALGESEYHACFDDGRKLCLDCDLDQESAYQTIVEPVSAQFREVFDAVITALPDDPDRRAPAAR